MRMPSLRWELAAGVLVWATPSPLPAQLTPERALDRRRLGDLVASADGHLAAFTVTEPPKGTDRFRHIYLYRSGTMDVRQLTNSAKSEWSPRFSPDGTRLAFLSDRGDGTGIWTLSFEGGEAQPVSIGKLRPRSFEWSPNGQSIAFLASAAKPEADEKKAKDKDDARVADRDSLAALWIIGLKTNTVRRLTRPPYQVSEFAWLPAGDRLALVATDHPASDQWTDRLFTIGANDTVPAFLAAPKGPIGDLEALPDGSGVSYVAARVDGPSPHDLWVQPLGGGPARNLTGIGLDRPIDDYQWESEAQALAVVQDGFTARLERIGLDGTHRTGPTLPVPPSAVARLSGGDLLVIGERATVAPEVWLVPASGQPRMVSSLNSAWKDVALVQPEIFRYRSFDRTEIEAALLLPPNRVPGQRLPLVVLVHGGPTGAWGDAFEPWGQLLVARGYAVVYPNIRGSTGYGWNFLVSNRGDWGGGDFKDLMVGVDTLIARGIADPARLGIAGWSYGGYMASWAITQTTRFKAAVTGAGMSDLATEYGTEAGPAYDEWFYGLPYEKPEGFRKSSPLSYITRARTPTLILQGEEDITDPISQSQMLYRALKRYGVETELVLYPREGHTLQEEKHLLDRMNRIVAWMERWLQ